jgi:hypothetical protein
VRRGVGSKAATSALRNLSTVKLPTAAAISSVLAIVTGDVGLKEFCGSSLGLVASANGDVMGCRTSVQQK